MEGEGGGRGGGKIAHVGSVRPEGGRFAFGARTTLCEKGERGGERERERKRGAKRKEDVAPVLPLSSFLFPLLRSRFSGHRPKRKRNPKISPFLVIPFQGVKEPPNLTTSEVSRFSPSFYPCTQRTRTYPVSTLKTHSHLPHHENGKKKV